MKFCIKLPNADTNTTLKCLIHQTLINLLILWFKICIKPLILAKFDKKAGFLAKYCEAHLRHHWCQNIWNAKDKWDFLWSSLIFPTNRAFKEVVKPIEMSSIHVATTGVPEAFFGKFGDFGTIGPSSPKIGYFCNCRAFLQMHDAKGHEIKTVFQKHADTMLNKCIRVIFIEKFKNPLKGSHHHRFLPVTPMLNFPGLGLNRWSLKHSHYGICGIKRKLLTWSFIIKWENRVKTCILKSYGQFYWDDPQKLKIQLLKIWHHPLPRNQILRANFYQSQLFFRQNSIIGP